MLDKNFLQSFLKVNNASETMSDADVRKVLQTAGWSESEVVAAVSLLRSGSTSPDASIGQSMKNFRSDMEFSSSQLSDLLGIDVVIDPHRVRNGVLIHADNTKFIIARVLTSVGIAALAIGLALSMGVGSAYLFEIGPFALP